MIIGLLALEQNAWMTERERKQFFELLDVPRHQINSFVYQKQFVENRDGDITTVESFRPFVTLPRWMKNRIKFRLRHPSTWNGQTMTTTKCILGTCKCHSKINFNEFVERTLRNE